MVSSSIQEVFYTGNASTVTAYTVPFVWTAESHVKAQRLDAGTGTVSVASGVATFTSAQSTLGIGSHVRISGTTYTIHSKTSTTVFQFTEEVTIASSSFHLPDDAVALVEGSTFTLAGVSGSSSITTNPAIAATALLRVYRELPYTQLTELPSTGPVPTESIEQALDNQVMMIQQLATAIANAGIIVPSGTSVTFRGTVAFADAAARAAATPEMLYQLGLQLDTVVAYYGSSLTAGGWTQATFKARVLTDPAGDTPLYVGELASYKGANIKNKYAPGIYKGTAVSAGSWELCIPNRIYDCFQAMPWDDTEPLDRATRMAGHSGQYRWVDKVTAAVAQPGMGTLELRFFTRDASGGRNVLSSNMEITAEDSGSSTSINTTLLDPGFGAAGSTVVINPTERIYCEVVSVGEDTTVTATPGSTALADVDMTRVCTGTILDGPDASTGILSGVAGTITGATTVVRSHPAPDDGSSYRMNGRIFARTISGSWQGQTGGVSGTTAITGLVAADTLLFCVGDRVIGPTAHPDCRIASIAATSISLTHLLLGDTTALTVISEDRTPVVQFTNISEASGQTVLDAHDTSFVRPGDSLWGTDVPALARVTAKSSTTVTSSAALTGNITGYTVRFPRRAATIAADTSIINCTTTDLLIGGKVTGTCCPPDTFITAVQVGQLTVNTKFGQAASGATTDVIEIDRENLQVTGSTVASSTSLTLSYSVSTTYIDCTYEDYYITGDGIQPGTLVTAASGVTLTLSKAAATTASGTYRLYRLSRWKGLSLSLAGKHYAGTT